jgi:hypothetical protein
MGSQYGPHGGRSGLGVGSRVIADEAHGYAAVFRPIPLPRGGWSLRRHA